nr:hypothetical protein [Candidatus Njordarchaeota archaeon]
MPTEEPPVQFVSAYCQSGWQCGCRQLHVAKVKSYSTGSRTNKLPISNMLKYDLLYKNVINFQPI